MRTTSTSTVAEGYAVQKNASGVITRTFVNTVYGSTTSTLQRDDIVKTLVAIDGWRKPTAYSSRLTTAEPGLHHMECQTSNGNRFETRGKFSPNLGGNIFTLTTAELDGLVPPIGDIDIAVVKARNNVADRVASFGESLAELKQSVSGLGKLASQIDQFVSAALSKDFRKVARSLGIPQKSRKHRRAVMRYNGLGIPNVGNAFLCWNFGLSPIISDMVSLAILLGEGKSLRVVGKGLYGRESGQTLTTKTYNLAQPYSAMPYSVNFRRKVESGTYVRLDYEMAIPALRNLSSYGLTDVPATVWALMPYSFLVDFVLPVSEVLRSLTATFGLSFKGGSATRFLKVEQKFQNCVAGKVPNGGWLTFRGECPDLTGRRSIRTVFTTEPNPVTLWIKDPLSVFSVATVFSLLASRLKLK